MIYDRSNDLKNYRCKPSMIDYTIDWLGHTLLTAFIGLMVIDAFIIIKRMGLL